MSKTVVNYKDVAPGADKAAQTSTVGQSNDSRVELLPFGVAPDPVATLEPNNWILSGKFKLRESQTLAFWSTDMSDDTGVFSFPPELSFDLGGQYSSVGISIIFDRAAGNYCSEVNIKWYQNDVIKADVDFYPDNTTYFCEQAVTAYDKVVITLKKTSLPKRYAKIEHIIFGIYRQFGMSDLRSASVTNEIGGVAETLPISTFKWTLDNRDDLSFMFQLKQPVEIRNNNNLLGVYYIDNHTRKAASIYDINCYDAVGVLSESTFQGGVYIKKSAKELLGEIVGTDFDIEYSEDVQDAELTGVLESSTKRDAIQQVLFAWGAYLSTDGSDALKVSVFGSECKKIGLDQVFPGVSVESASIVTEVKVTAHSYLEDTSGGVEINGKKYTDAKTVYTVKNPNVTKNEKQNVKEFTGATLVSPDNAQIVAQRLYDWYMRREKTKAKIVWKGESLGDCVEIANNWNNASTGNITKMEIKISNTIVASCESMG